MIDFSLFYIDEVENISSLKYDLFISVYDGCERTKNTFNKIDAQDKLWLLVPQYHNITDKLDGECLFSAKIDEAEYIGDIFSQIHNLDETMSICIDSTGFPIPHLMFLVQYLNRKGILAFDMLYSEPKSYLNEENTQFTRSSLPTRPVDGYEATVLDVNNEDALIVFSGYNDNLVTTVARDKSKAKVKYFFTGFPSLQADMYQQNLVQLNKSRETIGEKNVFIEKAPAYDPFVAAEKVQLLLDYILKEYNPISCIHISPLSTKPMAIASALIYLYNRQYPIDVIYPPSEEYVSGHAIGVKRTWKYTIELNEIRTH